MKIVLVIPHSHSWFWTQSCVAALAKYPPIASGVTVEIVIVNNSPWSPAIRGITDTRLGEGVTVIDNHKPEKYHASALDCIIEKFDFDHLFAWETDVLPLRPDWLTWFMDQMRPNDYAVGHWHHEQFINPSCTLYRGSVLRKMVEWCKENNLDDLQYWGGGFEKTQRMARNQFLSMGPFAEKRGWPEGTKLRNQPTGQTKGPGWYEPGQALYHWANDKGYTHTVCPTMTRHQRPGMPTQTFYGPVADIPDRDLEYAEMQGAARTVHLWGGTRALDVLKHKVECQFVATYTPFWLEREARFWRDSVPADVQAITLDLIRKYGWHTTGCGTPEVTERDWYAAKFIQGHYAKGGVVI